MKRFSFLSLLLFRGAYLLIMSVIFLGTYHVMQWQPQFESSGISLLSEQHASHESPDVLQASHVSDGDSDELRSASHALVSNGSISEYFFYFAAACSLSLVVICVAWPHYYSLVIPRWFAVQSEQLFSASSKHYGHQSGDHDLYELRRKLVALIKGRKVARGMINELERNKYNVAGDVVLHNLGITIREVGQEMQKNEIVLEEYVEGVIVFSNTGKIYACNRAAREILDIPDHPMGCSIATLLPIVISECEGQWKTYLYNTASGKEIGTRTQATISIQGKATDLLITCTHSSFQAGAVFTFFIQKISIGLIHIKS